MPTITTKQAAAKVRKHLKTVAAGHTMAFKNEDGEYWLRVPAGLRFNVRATRTGVNVTIEDNGYVDDVTGGDRRAWNWEHGRPVIDTIREYEQTVWGRTLGDIKWGDILIAVENVHQGATIGIGGDAA